MRRLLLFLSFGVACAALGATTGNNDSCDIGVAPAATLLLPYFEVSEDPLDERTIFNVTNVTNSAQVARVTLWTDHSYPVFTFNLYLTGYDVQTIDLWDVLNGNIRASRAARGRLSKNNPNLDESECGLLPATIPPLQVEQMKSAFMEGRIPGCDRVGYAHENAIGYATIDVVGNCGSAMPFDPKYFTEDIRFDNALIGDYQQVGAAQNFAQGNAMVHIRAIGAMREGRFTTNLPYTFYGRFQESAHPRADGRQPLPSTFAARWINGGRNDFQTYFKIWRQGITNATATCNAYRENALLLLESVVFDEDGNGVGSLPHECNMLCIGEPDILLPSTSQTSIQDNDIFRQNLIDVELSGWVYLNLDHPDYPPNPAEQGWVVVSMRSEGRYSVDMNAAAMGNGCSAAADVTDFSDYDFDGLLPGPAPDVTPLP